MAAVKGSFIEIVEMHQKLMLEAKIKIKEAQKKQKFYYNPKHAKPCVAEVGPKVLLKRISQERNEKVVN